MQNNQKIVITGANGILGSILCQGLGGRYAITKMISTDGDVSDYETVRNTIAGHTAIIHLARKSWYEKGLHQETYQKNAQMFLNIYTAAAEMGVKRIIMASSVHAGYDTAYGVEKISMEAWGWWFATQGLEVVCIRFGAINRENRAYRAETELFLSHRDGIALVDAILAAPSIPNNFAIVHGVSDNGKRIHDVANPFGWKPQNRAEDCYG